MVRNTLLMHFVKVVLTMNKASICDVKQKVLTSFVLNCL